MSNKTTGYCKACKSLMDKVPKPDTEGASTCAVSAHKATTPKPMIRGLRYR